MINNRRTLKCPDCGKDAYETVVADGFDDAPATFTITRECKGPCLKKYEPNITAQQMHKRTALPVAGWSETRY